MLISLRGETRYKGNIMCSAEVVLSAQRASAAFLSAITMSLVRENTSDFA